VLLRALAPRAALSLAAVALGATVSDPRAAASQGGPAIVHTPAPCLPAGRPARLVACVTPRSRVRHVLVRYRSAGEEWRSAPLRSDAPCFSVALARPGSARLSYVFEAEFASGETLRSPEYALAVVADLADCGAGLAAEAPAPAASVAAAPPRPAPSPPAPSPRVAATPAPEPRPGTSGGSKGRTLAIVAGGAAAVAGGVAVAARGDSTPASSLASGLPPGGVAGVYVGTQTIEHGAGCTGTDDVVLSLALDGVAVSGVLTFTVRTCPCCAPGRGANPVVGTLAGESLRLETPVGFTYTGAFAGNRLAGQLTGPGGLTGSFSVDKR
jgi:hypothetical protein